MEPFHNHEFCWQEIHIGWAHPWRKIVSRLWNLYFLLLRMILDKNSLLFVSTFGQFESHWRHWWAMKTKDKMEAAKIPHLKWAQLTLWRQVLLLVIVLWQDKTCTKKPSQLTRCGCLFTSAVIIFKSSATSFKQHFTRHLNIFPKTVNKLTLCLRCSLVALHPTFLKYNF